MRLDRKTDAEKGGRGEAEIGFATSPRLRITASPHLRITPSPRPRITASPRPRITLSPRPRITPSPRPRITPSPRPRISASPRPRVSASPRLRITASPRLRVSASPRLRFVPFLAALCFVLWSAIITPAQSTFSAADKAFLDDLQERLFQYFWQQADPVTGLVPDRARADGSALDENHQNVGSIAATGFGLTALCIATERRWVDATQAKQRARQTLRFFADRAYHQQGWFYHWLDTKTGERRWNSEVSSIDTALLLGGVLTVRQCFASDPQIVRLATKIYRRVDFRWMLNRDPLLLSHGWKPETGFLRPRWDTYSEDTILYLLGIGSPTFSISPRSWYALWKDRYRYAGHSYFTTIGVPLFMHQYSHAWVDYRGRKETHGDRIDYFKNSIEAMLAHRAFCINLAHAFPGYGPDVWGITASDSAKGYLAWGGPPHDPEIDGTVVPSAAGGSLMFTPELAVRALRTMREKFGEKIYGRYGFVDAFNPNNGWVNTDMIGINQGIILLSAENARTGNVWRWFMKNREIPLAMRRVGLIKYAPVRTAVEKPAPRSFALAR